MLSSAWNEHVLQPCKALAITVHDAVDLHLLLSSYDYPRRISRRMMVYAHFIHVHNEYAIEVASLLIEHLL